VKVDFEEDVRLLDVEVPTPHGEKSRSHLTRRGWLVVIVAACSVVGAVLGYLVADQIDQRDRFDGSQTSLRITRQHISAVSADLATLRHDVALLITQVGNDSTALTQDSSQLEGAQTALAAAQAHVSQQATLITSLQACLGGVEQALNALSVGKQQRAIDLLNAVSSSCTSAAAASG
jgi:hypothetical protein